MGRQPVAPMVAATLVSLFRMGPILLIMSTAFAPDTLSDADYRASADAVLAHVEKTIDRWLDDDVVDIDTSRTGGLLELTFPDGSKIVLNTQPPLQEIWLAARAGGFHYKSSGGRWLDTRNGGELLAALSAQCSAQSGRPLEFAPVAAS